MNENLTIGEVAIQVGLSARTIRFYESTGIIKPLSRQDNTYRRFNKRDIERLHLIKRARCLGLSLNEIRNIVSECIDKGCFEARTYIAERVPSYIENIDSRIAELQDLKDQLLFLKDHYKHNKEAWQHRTETCCQIIPLQVKET